MLYKGSIVGFFNIGALIITYTILGGTLLEGFDGLSLVESSAV